MGVPKMSRFDFFYPNLWQCDDICLQPWLMTLPETVHAFFEKHAVHVNKWEPAITELPDTLISQCHLDTPIVTVGDSKDLMPDDATKLFLQAKRLMPWRKGPFRLFGMDIDTEWRSDLKWARIEKKIDLHQKTVLDVGCGNGYYAFRMLGAGAQMVIGIDPTLLFIFQWKMIHHFMPRQPAWVFPLTLEEMPKKMPVFDTVFSMGVLYHRRSPVDHLNHLQQLLKPNGELILETLIVENHDASVLIPQKRYAGMPNVWFIFSIDALCTLLKRLGFCEIEVLDVSATTPTEQRKTEWIQGTSLADFLTEDFTETTEGYPAPIRVVIYARNRDFTIKKI